jgi:hypothetical protein
MLSAILRLFAAVVIIVALAILFFYAFVAALIITPILFVLFYFLGRKQNVAWWVVRRDGPYGQQRPGQGPVIDHDPNDLPPPEKQ